MAVVETLVIPAGKVASSLTNFVTRVDLAHLGAAWWADTTSDLGNVRVKQSGSVIPFDVVSYDRIAKTGELFFKASLTTSANTFTIETVDSATALPATDTNGRNNVWSDYSCVVLAAELLNRVNGNSASATVGTLTPSTTGLLTFDGSQRATWTVTKPTAWTMGFSGAPVTTAPDSLPVLTVNTEATTTDADREVLGTHGTTGNDPWGLWNTTDGWIDSTADVTTSRERLHATHDGTTSRKLWRGGLLEATDTTVAAKPSGTGTAFQVGGRNGSSTRWEGTIGYAYLRPSILTADWIAAETVSWETPASFYSIDATVAAPAATATAAALAPTVSGASDATVTAPAATAAAAGFAPSLAADATVSGTVATAAAEAVAPAVLGDGAVVVQAPAATATADALAPTVAADSSAAPPAATATAEALPPTVTAISSATVVAPVATASAAAIAPAVFNDSPHATVIAPAATASATAPAPIVTATFPVDTDVSNFEDGLELLATASVDVFVPGAFVATQKVDKAIALPVPTMVNGRPT